MAVRLEDPLRTLKRCPHCGVARPSAALVAAVYGDDMAATSKPQKCWLIYKCTSRLNPIMILSNVPKLELISLSKLLNSSSNYSNRIIPNKLERLEDWPEKAARYMQQAIETLSAPDGAVMLAGSAVDAMLKEKGYAEGTVYDRIESAVQDNLLTEAMGKWAHAVRLSANAPRHADLSDPHATLEQAQASIDFTRALGDFLFSLPARIERGRDAAQKSTGDADQQKD